MTKLRISKDLALPEDAVTQTIAILAKRGAGKTYTANVLAEEMVKAGLPICVLDPIGVWWGLRSSADGKADGLAVLILGGEHGDVPLESTAGTVIAEWVVATRAPVVLDLSLFSKGEQRRFVTDFAETLYRRNREALHVFLDEADAFAPQRVQPGEQRMLGAIEDLVRRGRARGLGLTLITQRSAVLNKDVLTQVEVLVAMRMLSPHDRKAIEAWIAVHGTREERDEVLNSLAELPTGTAWLWAPSWLGILKRIQIRKRETFDSSATPMAGKKAAAPKLAPVDLEQLRAKIADTIERAEAEDPKKLRAEIARLRKELAKKAPAVTVERVEVPVVPAEALVQVENARSALERAAKVTASALANVRGDIVTLDRMLRSTKGRAAPAPKLKLKPEAEWPKPTPAPKTNGHAKNGASSLPKPQLKILTALAQHGEMSVVRLAMLCGYRHTGGGYRNLLGALRTEGLINRGEPVAITDNGVASLPEHPEELPTGNELVRWWLASGKLGLCERKIVEHILENGPGTKEEIAEATGYEPGGGGYRNSLGRLCTLAILERHGAQMRFTEAMS